MTKADLPPEAFAQADRISDKIVDILNTEGLTPGSSAIQMFCGQLLALLIS